MAVQICRTPQLSKLLRQLCCLLLPRVDHVYCSPIPCVLNGHCRDTAHADEVEPELYVLGYIFKARRRACLKAGFLALPPYIRDERLVDIQRWPRWTPKTGHRWTAENRP